MTEPTLFPTPHDPGGKVSILLPAGMRGNARFAGPNGEYRLWLERWWEEYNTFSPYVLWIGMNPSTADANYNDPTITREIAFTRAFGFHYYIKTNVMDYRATHPQDLLKPGVVPCSPSNVQTIRDFAAEAAMIVLCYGVVPRQLEQYPIEMVARLRLDGRKLWCMGRTMHGHPRHPLYLRSDTKLETF